MRGAKQLKVGMRVSDLEISCALYLKLGFKQIPRPDESHLRYLTFGHTWLILSDRYRHGYHNAERQQAVASGPLGSGFVLTIPTSDLDVTYNLWLSEGRVIVKTCGSGVFRQLPGSPPRKLFLPDCPVRIARPAVRCGTRRLP